MATIERRGFLTIQSHRRFGSAAQEAWTARAECLFDAVALVLRQPVALLARVAAPMQQLVVRQIAERLIGQGTSATM